MKLYRGDSIPQEIIDVEKSERGSTLERYFCSNGLMSKFADGGNSKILDVTLLQQVMQHVGYERGTQAEKFSYHSPMLSFTSSIDKALEFCERRKKKRMRLVPCDFEEATHFIWELDMDDIQLDQGLFLFTYEADPINCQRITADGITRVTAENNIPFRQIAELLAQRNAAADTRQHSACLIDVVTFINVQPQGELARYDQTLVFNALDRASRDSEWLLYPKTPMLDGYGYSSRFVMNRHLKYYGLYRLQSV